MLRHTPLHLIAGLNLSSWDAPCKYFLFLQGWFVRGDLEVGCFAIGPGKMDTSPCFWKNILLGTRSTSNHVKVWAKKINLTNRELTWIPHREASLWDHNEWTQWAHRRSTYSELIATYMHGELIRMISRTAQSKLMVWVANSWKAHSKLVCSVSHLVSWLWGN